jgi:hypothetical protein
MTAGHGPLKKLNRLRLVFVSPIFQRQRKQRNGDGAGNLMRQGWAEQLFQERLFTRKKQQHGIFQVLGILQQVFGKRRFDVVLTMRHGTPPMFFSFAIAPSLSGTMLN